MTQHILKWAMRRHTYRFEMPVGSEIVHIAMQSDNLTLWTISDTEVDTETRTFRTFATGEPFSTKDGLAYLGSCHTMPGADFVWHVFEDVEVGGVLFDGVVSEKLAKEAASFRPGVITPIPNDTKVAPADAVAATRLGPQITHDLLVAMGWSVDTVMGGTVFKRGRHSIYRDGGGWSVYDGPERVRNGEDLPEWVFRP